MKRSLGLALQDKHLIVFRFPGDSWGITKYHSNQYVCCWKQWRTDELVDVLCPSGAYEKIFWCFFILVSLPATDLECLIRNLIFNSLRFKCKAKQSKRWMVFASSSQEDEWKSFHCRESGHPMSSMLKP